jgi:hypothetical protein
MTYVESMFVRRALASLDTFKCLDKELLRRMLNQSVGHFRD